MVDIPWNPTQPNQTKIPPLFFFGGVLPGETINAFLTLPTRHMRGNEVDRLCFACFWGGRKSTWLPWKSVSNTLLPWKAVSNTLFFPVLNTNCCDPLEKCLRSNHEADSGYGFSLFENIFCLEFDMIRKKKHMSPFVRNKKRGHFCFPFFLKQMFKWKKQK